MCGGLFSVCQSERSLCCQDIPSFGNSLTKMSHLSAGDPRTVRLCVVVCLVCVSLNGPCVLKMPHLSAGDPRTVRSCMGVCLVCLTLKGPCVVNFFGDSLLNLLGLMQADW